MNVLVTGARGFLGRNLIARLRSEPYTDVLCFDIDSAGGDLADLLSCADVIFHLAGVNRPRDPGDFERGNADLTREICRILRLLRRTPRIVMSSSIQAALDNPYGISKLHAEKALIAFARETGAEVSIYRLKNVFGKWARPNYNSVVATFCHSIANDLAFSISDPSRSLDLVCVDDVVTAFLSEIPRPGTQPAGRVDIPSHTITLGELAGRIQAFHEMNASLIAPDFAEPFNRSLYAAYLSYVPGPARVQQLDIRSDNRGTLAEFMKSPHFGQIFVSRTARGVTRGNHYHHSKAEKFFVVEGHGIIRLRHVEGNEVQRYAVRGEEYRVIDIPPGFTHSIENVGSGEMVTLFWASQVFDPDHPDTYFMPVEPSIMQDAGSYEGGYRSRHAS